MSGPGAKTDVGELHITYGYTSPRLFVLCVCVFFLYANTILSVLLMLMYAY